VPAENYQLFVAERFDDFIEHSKYLIGWAFRGHADVSWLPMSSIERFAKNYYFPIEHLWNREDVILREFQKAAHQFIENVPSEKNKIEWLSLLQHYGGPTRLVDFTKSEYVASFFAMEHATVDAAVWGINLNKIAQVISDKVHVEKGSDIEQVRKRHLELAEMFIGKNCDEASVLDVEPNRVNKRIMIQQGLFIFPADIRLPFINNLAEMFDIPLEILTNVDSKPRSISTLTIDDILEKCLIKIILPRQMHKNALFRLARMNISAASLFPGLDGFSRSFELHMRIKDIDDGLA
jgi:hypothetical protein